jgi:hypothetical protein
MFIGTWTVRFAHQGFDDDRTLTWVRDSLLPRLESSIADQGPDLQLWSTANEDFTDRLRGTVNKVALDAVPAFTGEFDLLMHGDRDHFGGFIDLPRGRRAVVGTRQAS